MDNLFPAQRQIEDPRFAAFWQAYPRRDDKGHARIAYRRALGKAPHETIMDGLAKYRFEVARNFIPLPATWLNGERWICEPGDDFDPVLRAAGLTPEDFDDPGGNHPRLK